MTQAPSFIAEYELLPPLLSVLFSWRRLRQGANVAPELPWRGRRVDLAVLTRSGLSYAFELKLKNFPRVLEQAVYNASSFDRSWIVLPSVPSKSSIELARTFAVGIITVGPAEKIVIEAPRLSIDPIVRARLAKQIAVRGGPRV